MRRTRFADWDCSVARATDILGDWWTPLVVRSALLGVRRFDDFVEMLGIPRNVLTERLSRLVDEGILRKVAYQEAPVRYEYRLTEKGLGLYPVIVTLLEWGNEFFEWPDGEPPVHLVDRDTGERIEPVLVDAPHRRAPRPAPHEGRLRPRPQGRPRRRPQPLRGVGYSPLAAASMAAMSSLPKVDITAAVARSMRAESPSASRS